VRNWAVRFTLKNRRRQPGLSGPKSAKAGLTFAIRVPLQSVRNEAAAQIISRSHRYKKGHHVGGLYFLFLKARGKELVRLGLRVLIHLGIVSERKVELLTEFGSLGVRKRVHCAGILDDPIIGLRCV
jgi:hypothetical protein